MREPGLIFDISQQQVITHGDPDLAHHRVFAGSQKRFDLQVLLDPLEKQFDLPAGFINPGNRGRR